MESVRNSYLIQRETESELKLCRLNNPNTQLFTFWSYKFKARLKNNGKGTLRERKVESRE